MDEEAVFRRYDIRGAYPMEVNGEFAGLLGRSFGSFARQKGWDSVVVSKDTKNSSRNLKEHFEKGLRSTGVKVLDAGTGPTDYAAYTGMLREAPSVQITSSHLALDTNGFKFMYPRGNGFMNPDLDRVKDIFRQREFVEGEGNEEKIENEASTRYRSGLKRYFRRYFDTIDRKIVVETMGGAATPFLPGMLEELGAEVVDLSEGKDEPYINPPNPKPPNLKHLRKQVKETDADIGIATDMDADRIALYHGGEWVGGNELFCVFAEIIRPEQVVASIDTSKALEDVLGRHGGVLLHTRVGDPFVIYETVEVGAALSGEPNGHYCFTDFVPYNSGTLAGMLLAAAELDSLRERVPRYHNLRASLEVEDKQEKMESIAETVRREFDDVSELDGVKFPVNGSNVLIRSSGSSPKIRIIVESKERDTAEKVMKRVRQLVRNS